MPCDEGRKTNARESLSRWVLATRNPHNPDTTGNAMRCNAEQSREEKPACICGIGNLVQTPATPDGSLVAGAGQRFESARRLLIFSRFAGKTPGHKGVSAPRPTPTHCNPPQKRSWSNGGGMAQRASLLTVKHSGSGLAEE